MERRVIIAGSRSFNDYKFASEQLDNLLSNCSKDSLEIVCGEARGADLLGRRYATEHGIKIKSFPAQWNLFGRSAGMIRNRKMAEYATELIAFWDGKSVGTYNMIQTAKAKELIVHIISIGKQ